MKRISLLIFMFIFTLVGYSQIMSSKAGHFNMPCPKGFVKGEIVNAPHMLLKLTNDSYNEIDISMWEYEIDESYTMWDDILYETAVEGFKASPNLTSLNIDKLTMKFKNKNIKAIKTTMTTSQKLPSYSTLLNMSYICYQFLYKGSLMQIMFVSYSGQGALSATKCENIISTITLTN